MQKSTTTFDNEETLRITTTGWVTIENTFF
jgi:hypothetical protein